MESKRISYGRQNGQGVGRIGDHRKMYAFFFRSLTSLLFSLFSKVDGEYRNLEPRLIQPTLLRINGYEMSI